MPGRQARTSSASGASGRRTDDRHGDLDPARQNFVTATAEAFAAWAPEVVARRLDVNAERCTDDLRAAVTGEAADLSGAAGDLADRYLGDDRLWPHRRAVGGPGAGQGLEELDVASLRPRIALLMGEVGRLLIDSGVEPRVKVSSPAGISPRPAFGPRGSQAWRAGATDVQAVSWTGSVLWTEEMQTALDQYNEAVARAREAAGGEAAAAGQPAAAGEGADRPGRGNGGDGGDGEQADGHQAGGDEPT